MNLTDLGIILMNVRSFSYVLAFQGFYGVCLMKKTNYSIIFNCFKKVSKLSAVSKQLLTLPISLQYLESIFLVLQSITFKSIFLNLGFKEIHLLSKPSRLS